MSDNAPMLHQEQSNAPMLGGDKRPVACPYHGNLMIRDWFGNPVCEECIANQVRLAELRESPLCPHCGATEYLAAELEVIDPIKPFRVLYIYCDSCENMVWENCPSTFFWKGMNGGDQTMYLLPHGQMTDWF